MTERVKPRVSVRNFVKGAYNVLVCRKDGEVFIAWSGSYKQAAFRQAHKFSPHLDAATYRGCVVRPGDDLLTAVNWVIDGWTPES